MKKLFFQDDGFIPNSRFPVVLNWKTISFRGMSALEAEALLKEQASETKIVPILQCTGDVRQRIESMGFTKKGKLHEEAIRQSR